MKRKQPRYYTGVGSRDTPKNVLNLMEELGFALSQEGWTLRSGGAEGADSAFQRGASHLSPELEPEIYIPWEGFGALSSKTDCGVINASQLPSWYEALKLASTIHPVWDKLTRGPKALHARNMMQVLGCTLDSPSKFLVCYSKPSSDGYVQGGTRSAYKLAKDRGIPCFNLYEEENYERVEQWLKRR